MAYDYQIAKMITSKLLKVKLKSNTRKDEYFDVPKDFKYSTRNIFRYDN